MHEDVGAASILSDEAEALFAVEPLNTALSHAVYNFFSVDEPGKFLDKPPVLNRQLCHDRRRKPRAVSHQTTTLRILLLRANSRAAGVERLRGVTTTETSSQVGITERLGQQDRGARETAMGQVGERVIGSLERVRVHGHLQVVLTGEGQEVARVPASIGGDRANLPLLE